jgi:hypothetical protein
VKWQQAVVLVVLIAAVTLLGVLRASEFRELVSCSLGAAAAWLFGARRELGASAADRASRELPPVERKKP